MGWKPLSDAFDVAFDVAFALAFDLFSNHQRTCQQVSALSLPKWGQPSSAVPRAGVPRILTSL